MELSDLPHCQSNLMIIANPVVQTYTATKELVELPRVTTYNNAFLETITEEGSEFEPSEDGSDSVDIYENVQYELHKKEETRSEYPTEMIGEIDSPMECDQQSPSMREDFWANVPVHARQTSTIANLKAKYKNRILVFPEGSNGSNFDVRHSDINQTSPNCEPARTVSLISDGSVKCQNSCSTKKFNHEIVAATPRNHFNHTNLNLNMEKKNVVQDQLSSGSLDEELLVLSTTSECNELCWSLQGPTSSKPTCFSGDSAFKYASRESMSNGFKYGELGGVMPTTTPSDNHVWIHTNKLPSTSHVPNINTKRVYDMKVNRANDESSLPQSEDLGHHGCISASVGNHNSQIIPTSHAPLWQFAVNASPNCMLTRNRASAWSPHIDSKHVNTKHAVTSAAQTCYTSSVITAHKSSCELSALNTTPTPVLETAAYIQTPPVDNADPGLQESFKPSPIADQSSLAVNIQMKTMTNGLMFTNANEYSTQVCTRAVSTFKPNSGSSLGTPVTEVDTDFQIASDIIGQSKQHFTPQSYSCSNPDTDLISSPLYENFTKPTLLFGQAVVQQDRYTDEYSGDINSYNKFRIPVHSGNIRNQQMTTLTSDTFRTLAHPPTFNTGHQRSDLETLHHRQPTYPASYSRNADIQNETPPKLVQQLLTLKQTNSKLQRKAEKGEHGPSWVANSTPIYYTTTESNKGVRPISNKLHKKSNVQTSLSEADYTSRVDTKGALTMYSNMRPLQRSPAVMGVSDLLTKTDDELSQFMQNVQIPVPLVEPTMSLAYRKPPQRLLSSHSPVRRCFQLQNTHDYNTKIDSDTEQIGRRSFYDYGCDDDEEDDFDEFVLELDNHANGSPNVFSTYDNSDQCAKQFDSRSYPPDNVYEEINRVINQNDIHFVWTDCCKVLNNPKKCAPPTDDTLRLLYTPAEIFTKVDAWDLPYIDCDALAALKWNQSYIHKPAKADIDEITLYSRRSCMLNSWSSTSDLDYTNVTWKGQEDQRGTDRTVQSQPTKSKRSRIRSRRDCHSYDSSAANTSRNSIGRKPKLPWFQRLCGCVRPSRSRPNN